MDKNEYKVKLDEIEKCVDTGNYAEAARIADQIDWKRVRNVRTLCLVSEIYEAENRYEDSKALLLRAYRRTPVGRAILYRLVEVTIKLKQFDEAIEYYSEYVQAAPHDTSRYILKYKIYRGRGSSVDEQIEILKEYLDQEYNEKYAYELARLYQEADRISDCLNTVDDLVLWFHSGKYVTKALELKKKYAALTPKQQEIYDHRFEEEDDGEDEIGQEKQIVGTEDTSLAESIVEDTTREIADEIARAAEDFQDEAQTEEAEAEAESTRILDSRSRSEESPADTAQEAAEAGTVEEESASADQISGQNVPDESAVYPQEENSGAEDVPQNDQVSENAARTAEEGLPGEADAAQDEEDGLSRYTTQELQTEMIRSMREIVSGVGVRDTSDADQEEIDRVIEQSKQDQEDSLAAQESTRLSLNRKLTVPELEKKREAGQLSIDDVLLSMGERGDAVREAASKAGSAVRPQPEGVLSAVDEALLNMGVRDAEKLTQAAGNAAEQASEDAEDMSVQAAEGIDQAERLFGDVRETAEEAVAGTADAVKEAVAGAADQAGEVFDGVKETAQDAVEAAESAVETAEEAAAGAAEQAGEVLGGVKETAEGAVEAAESAAETAEEAAAGAAEQAGEVLGGVKETAQDVVEAAESAVETAEEAVAGAADQAGEVFDGAKEAAEDAAENAAGAAETAEETAEAAFEAAEDVVDHVDEAAEEADLPEEEDETEAEAEKARIEAEAVKAFEGRVDQEIEEAEKAMRSAEAEAGPEHFDEDIRILEKIPHAGDTPSEKTSGEAAGKEHEAPASGKSGVQDAGQDMSMEDIIGAKTRRIPTEEIQEASAQEGEEHEESTPAAGPKKYLKDSLRGFFDGYLGIQNMERQIAAAIDQALLKGADRTSRTGNILIFGGHGCGKTTIATGLAKAIAQEQGNQFVKMAKIYATDLNRKDIAATVAKIAGGVLIVEEAGDLDDSVADQLTTAMEFRTDGLILILEDEQRYMHDLLMRHPRLTMKFTSQIYIPVFTVEELIEFGKLYADDHDYMISEDASSALGTKLSTMAAAGDALSITSVLDLVDQAVARANKFGRKLFAGKKRYDSQGRVILLEKDFR